MIIHLGKWIERMKYLALFVVLTYAFSHVYQWTAQWLDPVDKYREPEGHAVKAFSSDAYDPAQMNTVDRLKWFYWYGE